jgi:hypothetical protein
MAEAGGPANQAGIFYQNSIAALHLGRMLDLRARLARHRILNVRVEAPEEVDDIVVSHGDGSRRFLQAKRTLALGTESWSKLWIAFWRQLQGIQPEDRLGLLIGEPSTLATDLRACSQRTTDVLSDQEYQTRLTAAQRTLIDQVVHALAEFSCDRTSARLLFARLDVEIIPEDAVERDLAVPWMPETSIEPERLLSVLRDMVGGASRVRGNFDPATLRARLKDEHGIEIGEPGGWGTNHYRTVVSGKAIIEVPGTGFAGPIESAFLWPRASRYDKNHRPDFDDESPGSFFGIRSETVDLSLFPSADLHRVVVIAGPGFGKSALSTALAAAAVQSGLLPAIVSIPELSRLDLEIMEFLETRLNKVFEVAIDWRVATDSGLLVLLLDGLDEISTDRRSVVLERIKTFSFRHPATPWLLTVRDAAALSAPTDARLIELEPLDRDAIRRFIALYRPGESDLPEQMMRRIEAQPDLERLVRIPLFLAILVSSKLSLEQLPSSRTELLEQYLDILFRPEQFKFSEEDGIDPLILRTVAETVAFEALEQEEIGVSGRLLSATIRRQQGSDMTPQATIERLVKCGVLRRDNPSRYVFPFPIIQEYLAACHLLEHHLDEVPNRLSSAVKRPWAQALQFVLELHSQPSALVQNILVREDDAFSTNLRLVARCVANGMSIDPQVKDEIARRLAIIWPGSTWRMRGRIGNLIRDCFYTPMVPEVRAQLSNRALLHDGAGAVVARINDSALTFAVLTELLAGNVEHLMNLSELQVAVNALGYRAIQLYADRARASSSSEKEKEAMASLIGHMSGSNVSDATCLSVALDERLPVAVRLEAFALMPAPIDDRALPLIEVALAIDEYHSRSAAVAAIAKGSNPGREFRAALIRPDLDLEAKSYLVGYFYSDSSSRTQTTEILKTLADDPALEQELRWRLSVFVARHGDVAAMSSLVNNFNHLSIDVISATLSIFGHHRSRTLVETAVNHLTARPLQPKERVNLLGAAVLGMTAIFEMDYYRGGGVKASPPHPGLEAFRPLAEMWGAMSDYSPLDSLHVAHELVLFGSQRALSLTAERIEEVLNANEVDLQDINQAHVIGSAIRALRDRQYLLPVPFLERVIARCSYNGASGAVQMLAAHGSREAFESLMDSYDSAPDSYLRETILDSIETLSGRLGIRVRRSGSTLEASAAG